MEKNTVETQPLVSIVVVNFNGGVLLKLAVDAVLTSSVAVELFVVDNASSDDSLLPLRRLAERRENFHLIENEKNVGFAAACNIALRRVTGDYILLLNPDCIIKPDTLEQAIATLQLHPEAGLAGCLIQNPDGSEQAGCRRSVPTPWRTFVRVLNLDKLFPNQPKFKTFVLSHQSLPDRPKYLEAISGAFMLARRSAVEEVGLLDERYFLHCEDLDWCMRFRLQDWKILFLPKITVTHYKGTCSKDRPIRVLWHMHRGMLRFYRKFFRRRYPQVLIFLVNIAVWSRFLLLAGFAMLQKMGSKTATPQRKDVELLHWEKAIEKPVSNKVTAQELSIDITPLPTAKIVTKRAQGS